MEFNCLDVSKVTGFDWDDGNILKNESKHGIKWSEIEEVFFNEPLLLLSDEKHSSYEGRCIALGKTDDGKQLLVVYTLRANQIRPISARPMSKKERKVYESA